MNKQEILSIIKADLKAAKILRDELDSKILTWKKEYNAEPYGNEHPNRSKVVSRDIKKVSEWQHPSLLEPFVSTPDIIKASPVTFEDTEAAKKIEILLNTQFCRQFPRFNFMSKAIKVMDTEGTCVIRTGWEYEEKEVKEQVFEEVPNPQYEQITMTVKELLASGQEEQARSLYEQLSQIPQTLQQPKIVTITKPVKNQPTAMVCRNEDVFIDPTCMDDMDKAQFVIYRYETDLSTLRLDGRYKNLSKVEENLAEDSDFRSEDKTSFKFTDTARKKLVVYEYWGNIDINDDGIAEPIVCAWIGDVIIRLEDNPFPDKKPPFIVVPFNSVPFSLYGESNAELLSTTQKIKTAIYRGLVDNMALSNNGQKGIRKGALDAINKKRFLNGENFEFNATPNDFYDGHFNEFPASIFNYLQVLNNEVESITGVASFNSGINGNALGGTATGIRSAVDSASSRRLNIVRNISENLVKPLLRKWLAYDSEFLDEEAQFRITNEEFIWLKRDDLGANIDIDLNISTSDDNQAKASELAFILQTATSEDPAIRKMLMSEIARLYRMPELARMISEYNPQPDPISDQIRQLQVAMLQAQVNNEQAKADENVIDRELKGAKAQTEIAKAKNLNSIADKTDLDYLQQYYNTAHKNEMEKKMSDNDVKLSAEALKMLSNAGRNYL